MWNKLCMEVFALRQNHVSLTHEEIATLCNKGVRTVQGWQAELEEGGYLPVQRVTEGGFKVANVYYFDDGEDAENFLRIPANRQ